MALIPAANNEEKEKEKKKSLLRWGEQFAVFLIFTHPSHTLYTVWLSDRLISVLFLSITAILVGLFWRLPPEIHI